jgi:23S rRNA pseudouridine955/2504/2580 synthase
MREIKIGSSEENQRLDKYLLKYLNKSSKSFVYKMLRKKNIKLNNVRAEGSELLVNGDSIQMYLSDETVNSFMSERVFSKQAGKVSVVFEDDNILICNKPSGILSHSESIDDKDTMIDRILLYLSKKNEYITTRESTFTPAICNRLDRNTSGIIVCGKNLMSVQHLNKMFAEKNIDKYYITIVKGIIRHKGILKGYHIKDDKNNTVKIIESDEKIDNAKEVITEYSPIKCSKGFTYLQIKLITGKSHQIRAHLQKVGHEVVGDTKYGDKAVNSLLRTKIGLKNQLLHSEKIILKDDLGGLSYLKNREFKAQMPNTFKNALDVLMCE